MRDGLSIFDQAIAQANGETITGKLVSDMLGQANEGDIAAIFAQLMRGDIAGVLQKLNALHQAGTDPAAFLDDVLNVNHLVTRLKVTPALAEDKTLNAALREQAVALVEEFSLSSLSRVWQMLLKAVPEVANAPQPQQALEMALIRIGFAATLPPLEELLKKTTQPNAITTATAPAYDSAPPPSATVAQKRFATVATNAVASQPVAMMAEAPQAEFAKAQNVIADYAALVKLAEDNNEMMLAADLYANVRVVKFAQGQLQISVLPGAAKDLISVLPKKLQQWTGERWLVSPVQNGNGYTLSELDSQNKKQAIEKAYSDPAIQAIKNAFPEIKITDIKTEQ